MDENNHTPSFRLLEATWIAKFGRKESYLFIMHSMHMLNR